MTELIAGQRGPEMTFARFAGKFCLALLLLSGINLAFAVDESAPHEEGRLQDLTSVE